MTFWLNLYIAWPLTPRADRENQIWSKHANVQFFPINLCWYVKVWAPFTRFLVREKNSLLPWAITVITDIQYTGSLCHGVLHWICAQPSMCHLAYCGMYLIAQMTGIMLEELGAIVSTSNNSPVIYDRMEEAICCSNLLHLFILILDINLPWHSYSLSETCLFQKSRQKKSGSAHQVNHSQSMLWNFFCVCKSNITSNFTQNL